MIDFLILLLVPLAISIGALVYFKGKITILEFACQAVVLFIFVGGCIGIAYWSDTADKEIWNGQVTSKTRDEVSCRHSYECNCYYTEDCDSKGSCTQTRHCSTCYEHSYDVDWNVHSSINESVGIETIDRQGLRMPPRWGSAFVGEPWSSEHSYENYIKANPDSVLTGGKGDVEKWKALIPAYPGIYDYYKANHFINMGPVPDVDYGTWNWLVNEDNKTLGPAKQVNLLVLLVKTSDPSYVQAFKTAWLGGKKNDAVVIIGSEDGHKIAFAEVVSWAVRANYRDNLRDDIMEIGTLDRRDDIMKAVYSETQTKFVRMHMKDMQYLMRSFQPSGTAMWVTFILATLLSCGISFGFLWYYRNEHGWEGHHRRRR